MPKTFKAAVIGRTGRGGYGHGIDLVWRDLPNVELVAVADDDRAGLAAAAKRLKLDKTYGDYRRMLDEVKPDVVGIGPRWIDQHRDMVVAAAERGIHIYMEKPFCRTLAEADEMIAACQRTHVKLAIAHQTRYSPKLAVVERLLADGKLGRVLEFRGRGKEDQRGGGEDLFVLGTHIMDLIRALAGEPTWCFASVLQNGRPITASDVREGPEGLGPLAGDAVRAAYGLPKGVMAYFSSYRNAGGGKRFALQILGSEGILEMQTGYLPSVKFLADPTWSPGRSGAKWQDVSSQGIGAAEPLKGDNAHEGNALAVKDLLAAIEENREPLDNMYEARGATEMILAVYESQRLGRAAPLPLENRQHPLTLLK
jgi:predicted dehydrogenase